MRKSKCNIISFNSFLSSTLTRHIALSFLDKSDDPEGASDDLESVMFEIDANPSVQGNGTENTRSFAKIEELTEHKDEVEVLFMLCSVFYLDEICHDESTAMSIIRMTLGGDHDSHLERLYNNMKKRIPK